MLMSVLWQGRKRAMSRLEVHAAGVWTDADAAAGTWSEYVIFNGQCLLVGC
jgi:hypothetical protein